MFKSFFLTKHIPYIFTLHKTNVSSFHSEKKGKFKNIKKINSEIACKIARAEMVLFHYKYGLRKHTG